MAIETKAQLKTYFETGDIPTEAQFINVFDTMMTLNDGEINSLTEKTTAAANDLVVIEDSAASNAKKKMKVSTLQDKSECVAIACSDLTTDLATGTSKGYIRLPFAMTLTSVRASVLTAPTGSGITVDINESGTTILSTKLTIDATEKTSQTAATPAVISDSSLADDAEITVDIDAVGSTVAGAGLIVTLIGTRT